MRCLQFLLGLHPHPAQQRVGQLGEERFDHVQPGAVLGCEDELESVRHRRQVRPRLLRDMRRMVVEHQPNARPGRIGPVQLAQERDELPAAVPLHHRAVDAACRQVQPG